MKSKLEALDPAYWSSAKKLATLVGGQLTLGRVLICVGAGVSRFANLPNWSELLHRVADEKNSAAGTAVEISWDEDPYDVGQQILDQLFSSDKAAFVEALRLELYRSTNATDFASAFADPGMQSLSFLCNRSIRGGVSNIVNYNFDDMFKKMFAHMGVVSRAIDDPHYLKSRADVDVFHPHGVLSATGSSQNPNKIVIARQDLLRSEREDWHGALSALFSTHFPVLVGLSGRDQALLKILEASGERNPLSTRDKWPYFGVALCVGDINTEGFEKAGIKPHIFSEAAKWPEFVTNACSSAAAIVKSK